MSNPRRHLGVRLNALDLLRATEQTAILLSEAMGRRARVNLYKQWGLEAMLGYFGDAYLQPRFVHQEPDFHEGRGSERVWKQLAGLLGYTGEDYLGRFPSTSAVAYPELNLDLCISPIDGKRALSDGVDGGSISILAGGAAESFRTELHARYLVLVVSPALGKNLPDGASLTVAGTRAFGPAVKQLVEIAEGACADLGSTPTVGLGLLDPVVDSDVPRSNTWYKYIGRRFRCHRFQGSTTAGALATLFARIGIHAFISLSRAAHVVIMAAAARATGGALIAFPIERFLGGDGSYGVPRGAAVLRETDIVRNSRARNDAPDIFVVATGIGDNLILRGVRYRGQQTVSTHSLCLIGRTRSQRFVEHTFDMKEGRCVLLAGDPSDVSVQWTTIGKALSGLRARMPKAAGAPARRKILR